MRTRLRCARAAPRRVVEGDRDDRDAEPERGRDQRLGDARRDDREAAAAGVGDEVEEFMMPITVRETDEGCDRADRAEQPETRPQPLEDLEDPRVDEARELLRLRSASYRPGDRGQDRRRALCARRRCEPSPAIPRANSSVRRVPSLRSRARSRAARAGDRGRRPTPRSSPGRAVGRDPSAMTSPIIKSPWYQCSFLFNPSAETARRAAAPPPSSACRRRGRAGARRDGRSDGTPRARRRPRRRSRGTSSARPRRRTAGSRAPRASARARRSCGRTCA